MLYRSLRNFFANKSNQSIALSFFRWSWWVFLGILSSIGLGSGLHTFLIYLGPHIAAVTLASHVCNSLDFPEPPYPDRIVCPHDKPDPSSSLAITLWQIVAKVRVESLLWGVGTALGELPPYFMARAARISGEEPDDEEYKEFMRLMRAEQGGTDEMSWTNRGKAWVERFISRVGFPGILLFASIPNPLFDLAGSSFFFKFIFVVILFYDSLFTRSAYVKEILQST
ncbi:hypothetical protein OESDEN_20605 [Oesophagostomum dentatum]|uniref:Uncharacterized protein n=1 Tax=Oesophagostomum dentatum TaxID=61180 RepID=A0A0B1S478_OESDE|nr:hypothetical protein OESDEN_20605 [Oesophagostomum dentatum]